MLELFVDSDSISIENFEDLLDSYPEHAERAMSSAMKSEGNRLRLKMQKLLGNGGYGLDWPQLNPHSGILSLAKRRWAKMYKSVWVGEKGSKKRVQQHVGTKLSGKKNPMMKFKGGIRYKYNNESGTLSIGFINASYKFTRLINQQAEGYSVPVTRRVQKMAFALGFPLKKTTKELVTPSRPLVDPVFEAEKENVPGNIEAKFWTNLERYMQEVVT